MDIIDVRWEKNEYKIYITTSYAGFSELLLQKHENARVMIVTDENVKKLYLQSVISHLKNDFEISYLAIAAGEKSKSFKSVKKIYRELLAKKFTRKDIVIALGGGVIGDIVGYVAATYKRGLNFVQLPTSLLAQIDSSVGGKNGINCFGRKNIIGTFYKPEMVFINVCTVRTIKDKEIKNAIAEFAVHSIITDRDRFLEDVETVRSKIYESNLYLKEFVRWNCEIKSEIVSKDPYDKSIRKMLNFGHTIGHAIEATKMYKMQHGFCVALGCVAAFRLSYMLDLICEEEVLEIERAFYKLGYRIEIKNISINRLLCCIRDDKKNEGEEVEMILPLKDNKVGIVKFKTSDLQGNIKYALRCNGWKNRKIQYIDAITTL